jgi:hypothetical protein
MNFCININELQLTWSFQVAEVYNNAFHRDIIKKYYYNIFVVHKTDPTEPHTSHSGVVVLTETKDRIPEFIEFDDLTQEDLIKWSKRNLDLKEIYDIILDQMRYIMVYRSMPFKFNEKG